MPYLGDHPTLADLQRYVAELEREREFSDQNVRDKCLLLGEEVGELFKSVRRREGLKVDDASSFGEIAHELADILIYLCAIATRYDINLEEAFRAKEAINERRTWSAPRDARPATTGDVSRTDPEPSRPTGRCRESAPN